MPTKSISVWPVPTRLYACSKQYLDAQRKLAHNFTWWTPAASLLAYTPTQPGGAPGPSLKAQVGTLPCAIQEYLHLRAGKTVPQPGPSRWLLQPWGQTVTDILLLKSTATDVTRFESLVPDSANRFCKLGLAWKKWLSIPGDGENCF